MLEMRGVHKRFGAVTALNNASLNIKNGEIMALLGSNGSGKSTMVKILAGTVKPDSGDIRIDGQKVEIRSSRYSKELGIATAFQELSLMPMMSVADNLIMGHEPLKRFGVIDRKKALKKIVALLERFHIDCDPHAYVQTLMPSTQSILEVAKAVYVKSNLLLLDEVTATLHPDEVQMLFQILRELKAEGMAIVYVTHRMDEVFEICDRMTILRSGKLVCESDVKDLALDDILFHMTGKRPDVSAQKEFPTAAAAQTSASEPVLNVEHMVIDPKVKDISLKAYRGEIIGIAGLEGQGQPEFIRAILGATAVNGGIIRLLGKEVSFKSPNEAVKAGIGFISGNRVVEAIFPNRTIMENIFTGELATRKLFRFLAVKNVMDFARRAVEKYAIVAGSLKHPANSLSGGNQQKLCIARWIAVNPKLLLLDDPTKGVDIHSRREIHKILRTCADEQDMTIIISSSENSELLQIADRIYVLYEGQVCNELSGVTMTDERLVAAQMGLTEPR